MHLATLKAIYNTLLDRWVTSTTGRSTAFEELVDDQLRSVLKEVLTEEELINTNYAEVWCKVFSFRFVSLNREKRQQTVRAPEPDSTTPEVEADDFDYSLLDDPWDIDGVLL